MSLVEYLEGLQGTTLRKLYLAPSSVFAIFRRVLPPLAQTIIAKTLFFDGAFPLPTLDLIIRKEAEGQKNQALTLLRSLHIITISNATKDKASELNITANFRQSLRSVLTGTGNHNSFGVLSPQKTPPNVTIPFLHDYSRRKWDSVLQYVVNSTVKSTHGPRVMVGDVVKNLLMQGSLVQPSVGGLKITQAGFTFLLQESNAQVWTMLLLWLTSASNNPNMDSVDMLSFLFMLAALQLGRAYDTNALSESRRNMLPDLVDFGLVYIEKDYPHQYFPTRLATSLTASGSGALRSMKDAFAAISDDPGESVGILVETNYRLYCFTRSPLQIAVLSLFTKLQTRLPNMVTAKITKKSIQFAVDFGITADQIIRYLATHAHEQMHKIAIASNKPVLPPTVVDQIRLWQRDHERMQHQTGFMFKEFVDDQEYKDCIQYADEIGILIWKSDEKKEFFVSKHEQLANYLKLRKKAGGP
ncbi:uncharacterized protein MKZ38_000399 [Zalerion maritima]|uniref:RNA polymerase II transcription factor B subunit 2 n=1 Tax=Zalerion maritima TaxID=339359 RepID=A0AAD5WVP4_9PEZI|nr:uncharacterized protein MKZ38_000399 [Zalerion maritima]